MTLVRSRSVRGTKWPWSRFLGSSVLAVGCRGLAALLAPLMAAMSSLGAQAPQSVLGRHGVEVGADLGSSGDVASAFASNQVCPAHAAASVGLRVRARLGGWFGAEVTGQAFLNTSQDECVDSPLRPPAAQGPDTRRYDTFDDRIMGYPFAMTAARLQVVPLAQPVAEVRVFAGIGRIWSKNVTVPQSGIALLLGRGAIRFMAEAELWWYQVPQHRITEIFQDGRQVSRLDDIVQLHERTTVFRAGVTVR